MFTSEDLLKAMGLKLGDKIDFNGGVGKIYFDDVFGLSVMHRNQIFRIEALIGVDYTIIQPKPTLTEDEKVILRNVPKEYKYICRNIDVLQMFEFEPIKYATHWEYSSGKSSYMHCFNHLFQFIKWEDEPYSIEELLKE